MHSKKYPHFVSMMKKSHYESLTSPISGELIQCFAPATGGLIASIAVDSPDAVSAAVERARAAQPALGERSPKKRTRLLQAILDGVVQRADEIVDLVVLDSGKTHEHALMGEVFPVAEKIRWTIANGPKHLAAERVGSGLLPHKRARIEYRPLGVKGAIVPWNYPFQNFMNPIVSGLMAGNAVIVKPSEWVAYSSARFASMLREILRVEGYPADLVQIVQGGGETGAALIEAGIDGLLFIGSEANGKKVLHAAADALIPVVLELGGKDPMIVFEDAHLEAAAHGAINGCFINAGQNCVSSERILVQRSIARDFEERVSAIAQSLRVGPSTKKGSVDVGAVITPPQLRRVEALVNEAIGEGARLVVGGARLDEGMGSFFQPTILAGLKPSMQIMNEEVFGPVMLIAEFEDEDEALRIANGTRFGLGASLFTRDRERAARILSRLDSGMAAVNEFGGATYMAQDLPFGGIKASGFGQMNGRDGLRAFTRKMAIVDDALDLPMVNALFPVTKTTYRGIRSAIDLLYGRGPAKLHALPSLFGRERR